MLDIMVELGTMSRDPNAAIVSIGAVEFDTETQEIGERFYAVIDLASSAEAGGTIDASTVLWWMRQGDVARAEFSNVVKIADAFLQFSDWAGKRGCPEQVRIWGNGAAFDNVILETG